MAKARLLIVEDERVIALSVKMIVERLGYAVTAIVTSGEDAVEEVRMNRPDLIIMDIVLEGKLNGIEATRIINEEADIPVIYASAFADREIMQEARITKPYSFIIKPIRERELEVILEIALDRSEMMKQQKELIKQLEDALARVTALSGLLPICANCKKIRDDAGYWHQVEEYIHNHSDADFTHGLCPECARNLYPDIFND